MQQRENKNNNSEPLGICHRLFNFIMDTLNPQAPQSIEVPVEGSSVFRVEPEYYPKNSNSDIRVDFRHANGLENHVAKNGNATVNGEKGSIRPVESGIIRPTRIVSGGEVNGRELDSISTGGSRGKPSENVEGINRRVGEKEKNKNKDKHTLTEAAAGVAGEAEDKPMMSSWEITFLADDINGRATEYIKKKKIGFLRRSNTLEPKVEIA